MIEQIITAVITLLTPISEAKIFNSRALPPSRDDLPMINVYEGDSLYERAPGQATNPLDSRTEIYIAVSVTGKDAHQPPEIAGDIGPVKLREISEAVKNILAKRIQTLGGIIEHFQLSRSTNSTYGGKEGEGEIVIRTKTFVFEAQYKEELEDVE